MIASLYYAISSTIVLPFIYFLYDPRIENSWFLFFLLPTKAKWLLFRSDMFNIIDTKNYIDKTESTYGYIIFTVMCYVILHNLLEGDATSKYLSFWLFYTSILFIVMYARWYRYNFILYAFGYKTYEIKGENRTIYLISKDINRKATVFKINKDLYIS